ncbi:MAG: hypothetical protein K5905_13830, partial [Roseibium sp.]|uniref:hypothetical protein n=1 Tax=Roseibium sp. TaxID=1936156 RepID=UPI0026266E25
MVARYQTINEERGAQKAADLRRRFRRASRISSGRPQFGMWPSPRQKDWSQDRSRQAQFREFVIWSAMAAIV